MNYISYIKTIIIAPFVIILLLLFKLDPFNLLTFLPPQWRYVFLQNDVSAVGGYLTVIGTHYSILTAFIIFVVWEQFNKISDLTDKEAKKLSELTVYISYLNDPNIEQQIKMKIKDYAQSVIDYEWKDLYHGYINKHSKENFRHILSTIKEIKFNDSKDPVAFQSIIKTYEDISDIRQERLVTSTQRMPVPLRILLYLVSFSVIAGFFLLYIENDIIAIIVTALTTTIVVLVIEVINDLDDPFTGIWAIHPTPFKELIAQM